MRATRWCSLSKQESRIMLQAWRNPGYKAQLLASKAVLITEGFQIADVATVTILENDAEHLHLFIPTLG